MLDTSLTKLPRAETSFSDVWRIRAQETNSKVDYLKRWRLIAKLLKLVEYLLTGLQYCFPNDTTHLHLLQHSLVLTNLIILTKSFINPGHDTPGGNSDFVQCNDKLVFHIIDNPTLPLSLWTIQYYLSVREHHFLPRLHSLPHCCPGLMHVWR